MASETDVAEFLERLIQLSVGRPRFFPVILALASGLDDEEEEEDYTGMTAREQVERRIVMISSDWLVREFLDTLHVGSVVIGEKEGSCAICLKEWLEGDVAAEMPCKHEFHLKCVEEWLGFQSTCPLCRYQIQLPVEEGEDDDLMNP